MIVRIAGLDRRRFLRGSGFALGLPLFECTLKAAVSDEHSSAPKRLACFYFADGVPMPLPEDPAFQDWSWFPHGGGHDFQLTRCMEPLETLRSQITVLSGLSHPAGRTVHGHNNADQFLTSAATGGGDMEYANSVSLDQLYAQYVGGQTRFSSLVMSTDGGTGTVRGAHTMSFDQNGKAIPAENRPKRIFDQLFVSNDANAARRLAQDRSALDELMEDARALRMQLSANDRERLDDYLDAVRGAEQKVEKAKQWVNTPLPDVDADHLNLEVSPDDPRLYVRTMFELIALAFQTDSTRVATYQLTRENGVGISDHLARAVGLNLAHQLSHETKNPGGWERFGTYCRFLHEELGRFVKRLAETAEPGTNGSLLDHTLVLFGSASSAFHLSRNYPLILAGGKSMGFRHGQYLNYAGDEFQGGAWDGGTEPWQKKISKDDIPLSNLFVTMLQRLGMQTDRFGDSNGVLDVV